jgi:hypothetical protein
MLRSPLTLVRDWRAALLLVVVACASPNRASAECGSHVLVLNAPADGEHHALPVAGEMPASPKAPCSGPNCSRTPDHHTPPFAPVVTPSSTAKEAAHALDVIEFSDGTSSYPDPLHSAHPISRASSVFHPPRVG